MIPAPAPANVTDSFPSFLLLRWVFSASYLDKHLFMCARPLFSDSSTVKPCRY